MFGMSLADICGSIAMALTSLPMPSYMPKEEIFGYKWAGARLGNTYTCNAQGLFSTFGLICMFNYNAMLCLYYACAIAFTMRERNIKKYVEPILHGFLVLIGLGFAVPPLFYELYNPTTVTYAWCGIWVYPSDCLLTDDKECIRGNSDVMLVALYLVFVLIPLNFCIIVISLLLVILSVVKTDSTLKKMLILHRGRSNGKIEEMQLKHGPTKAVIMQALSYILSFLLTFTIPLFHVLGHFISTTNPGGNIL
jgi:hypothetical protein